MKQAKFVLCLLTIVFFNALLIVHYDESVESFVLFGFSFVLCSYIFAYAFRSFVYSKYFVARLKENRFHKAAIFLRGAQRQGIISDNMAAELASFYEVSLPRQFFAIHVVVYALVVAYSIVALIISL